jgi:hypothetical protein
VGHDIKTECGNSLKQQSPSQSLPTQNRHSTTKVPCSLRFLSDIAPERNSTKDSRQAKAGLQSVRLTDVVSQSRSRNAGSCQSKELPPAHGPCPQIFGITHKAELVSGLLGLSAYPSFSGHEWTRSEAMNELIDFSTAQYAVIEARRTEGLSERFVIGYSDEESLRDLIAGPSIIACGFTSREEAQAKVDANFCTAAAWKQTPKGSALDGAEKSQPGVPSAKRRLEVEFDLTQTGRIVRGFLQSAVAAAILIFYSRNAVSTIIRSFVGDSS